MLYKGILIGAASGKIDGLIASHNRGGQYFKAYVVPTDPATERQLNCRTAMTETHTLWNTITPAQRSAWEAYAKQLRRVNALGDAHSHTGYNEFIRANVPRYQAFHQLGADWSASSDAPILPQAASNPAPVLALISGNTQLQMTWDPADSWTTSVENGMLLYLGTSKAAPEDPPSIRPLPATRNWFRGPYELVSVTQGDSGSPPDNARLGLDYPPTTDQRIFWRARLSSGTHGLSAVYSGVLIAE